MKKGKLLLTLFVAGLLFMGLCLTACAGKWLDTSEISNTPQGAIECTLESLKVLDLNTFNEYTDNYIATQRNWLGIPVRREYQVFNELLQSGLKSGKKYKWNRELAEKIVENLSWKIEEVREQGDEAQINITLTNKDLTDVAGIYEINLLRSMVDDEGIGMMNLVREVSKLANDGGDLCAIVDEMDQMNSISVTVQAKKENGKWKICLSEDFIEAFMGNIGGRLTDGKYSDEIEQQIKELELEMYDKADQIGEDMERWAEGLFE